MQRARFWILCAMGALVVISGILLFGTRYWTMNASSLKNMLPANVDMRLDNLVLNESGDGDRSLIVNADRANYYKAQDLFILDKVRARIIDGDSFYDVTGETGRYEQGARIITLEGDVEVVDNQGGVLKAPSLILRFQESLLTSDQPFCYSTPTSDLEGLGFNYHTRDKLLKVEGRVHLLF